MEELVRLIIEKLVDDPENVDIQVNEELGVIHVYVDKKEIGRVIGKQGRIAKAIRSIVKACSMKSHKKYLVEIDEK